MATTIFVSPGVYTREQDFSFFASKIGITKLGVVGLTLKGPAFEVIKVSTTDEFAARFGTTDVSLQVPYVANAFLKQSNDLTIIRVLGETGFTNSLAWIIQSSGGTGSGSATTVAIIRSKVNPSTDAYYYDATNMTALKMGGTSSTNNLLQPFIISATTGPLTAFTNSGVTVSLDETNTNYIVKILGQNPLATTGDYGIYVESIYPHWAREATNRNEVVTIATAFTINTNSVYTNYSTGYTNSVTPYIVGRVIGSSVRNLFKVETISDGDASAKEMKISIANVDIVNNTFDLIVRNFSDTDGSTANGGRLEMFRQLTMNDSSPNFIGKMIGTTDETYARKSLYISITLASNYPTNDVPAGFAGYNMRYSASTSNAPGIYYKANYLSGDTNSKAYLGISELAYSGFTSDRVAYNLTIQSVETDFFKHQGTNPASLFTTKGFHMENTADSTLFVSGSKNSLSAYTKDQRKFTVVPAGGFDAWDKYRTIQFRDGVDLFNIQAVKDGIDLLKTPEAVDINLLATPGFDYYINQTIVKYALNMAETRTDTLYIIDSPRGNTGTVKGTAQGAVDNLVGIGIDSNYAATYWPWIQVNDAISSKNVYIAPTAEVVRAIAYTDNIAFPWFAVAGPNRGKMGINILRADVRLTRDDKDILYDGRVNPINTTIQDGVHIFGNKTLQIAPSALDRIHVRRLLLAVRRLIAAASTTLLFEQNDQTLRDQFLAKVQPILLQIKNQRGLTDFRIIMDSTNNTADVIDHNTVVGKIQLKPTPVSEYFDLQFQILPQGANFSQF